MKLTLLKAELLRNRTKALFNIFIIAIAVTVFIVLQTITHSYKVMLEKPFQELGTNLIIQKTEKGSQPEKPLGMRGIRIPFSHAMIAKNEFENIKKIPEIDKISKSLLVWDMSQGKFQTILGVDPQDPAIGATKIREWVAKGRFLEKSGDIVIEKHFAKFKKLDIGKSFKLGNELFNVVGLVRIREGNQLASANAYILHEELSSLAQQNYGINTIYVTLKDVSKSDRVKKKILAIIPDATISSSTSFMESTSGIMLIIEKFSLLIYLVTAVVAFFLILKVMYGSFTERIHEIGILKAVGWNNNETRKELIFEAVVQNILGCFLGFIFSILVCWLVSFVPFASMLSGFVPPSTATEFNLETSRSTLPFVLLPHLFGCVFAGSVVIGIICGSVLGNRALKIKPSEVLNTV